MKDVSVFVGNTSDTPSLCAVNAGNRTVLFIKCHSPLYGRYVKIYTGLNDTSEKRILSLEEVYVITEEGTVSS